MILIDHANKVEKIRNVVFMGMGEPLDNYDAVLGAIKGMIDPGRFGLSCSRVSVSTVGVVPRIRNLITDMPQVGLALSLHAPTQELRQQIVPTSKAWPIEKIMKAATDFVDNQNKDLKSLNRKRHILVEYVIIKDVNDSVQVAHQLGKLLQNVSVLLNIIPYNPTAVPYDYKPPLPETCAEFVRITREDYGLHTLYRQEMGQDISSACGQLVIESKKSSCVADIEDVGSTKLQNSKRISRKSIKKSEKKTMYQMKNVLTATAITFGIVFVSRLIYKYSH